MVDTGNERSRKTVKAVETTLSILDTIDQEDGAGVTELADSVGMTKGAVSHHLATLEQHGFVTVIDGEYHLGLRFLRYGGKARERERLYQIARQSVDKLARETDETVRLVVHRGRKGMCLYQAIGDAVSNPVTYPGTEEPLHCTAAGKSLLSEFRPAEIDEYLDTVDLVQRTPHTITDPDRLRGELDSIRETNIAYDNEEHVEGIRCVGTAITDETGELLGAISVSAPVDRMDEPAFRDEVPHQLQNAAGVIGISTTYSVWE